MLEKFPIAWVIDQDLPDVKKYKAIGGFNIDCPFCADKKHKFNVNTQKNVSHCILCGSAFSSVSLHAKLCNLDNKEAYKDLSKRYKGLSSDVKAKLEKVSLDYQEDEVAPLWLRDALYRAFINHLSLSSDHRQSLYKRGLDDQNIDMYMYRDVPEKEMDISEVVKEARQDKEVDSYFRNHKNVAVAGFYDLKTAPKTVANRPGILLPILIKNPHRTDDAATGKMWQEENLISGFQIRFDNLDKKYYWNDQGEKVEVTGKRYMPFYSSDKKTGARFAGYESIHFRLPDSVIDPETMLFERPIVKQVIFTEGVLKSDVASALSNNSAFIACLGVNNVRHLEAACSLLKRKYQTEEIILAFDADKYSNEHVMTALNNAKKIIEETGLKCSLPKNEMKWKKLYEKLGDPVKGVDDLFLYFKKEREGKK